MRISFSFHIRGILEELYYSGLSLNSSIALSIPSCVAGNSFFFERSENRFFTAHELIKSSNFYLQDDTHLCLSGGISVTILLEGTGML